MTFTELFSSKINTASQTISSINCFAEFISSKFNDLANFVSGTGEYTTAYFLEGRGTLQNKLGCIDRATYDQACESPERIFNIPTSFIGENYHTPNDLFQATGLEITDAVEHQLSELRCQEQYISYCLNAANCTATEFLSRMRSLCPNIASAVVEKFSNLIEISGSPVDCLKNFFSLFKEDSVSYENQTISLVDYNDYIGNIWQSAWQTVTDTLFHFFDDVWQGIEDIDGFFKRLVEAISKLGKWIISKAFHELSTNYDMASSAAAGIMDLPLFQVYGTDSDWGNLYDHLQSVGATAYSVDGYNHKLDYSPVELLDYLHPSLLSLMRDEFDGVEYTSVCEVIVPSDPYDLALRLGRDSVNRAVLTVHVVSDYGSWSAFTDEQQIARITTSLNNGLRFISQVCPLSILPQDSDQTDFRWNTITKLFINAPSDGSTDIIDWLSLRSASISNVLNGSEQLQLVIAGITVYMILMSKGFISNTFDYWTLDSIVLPAYLFNPVLNTYEPSDDDSEYVHNIDPVEFDIALIGKNFFRPYAKRNQLPVTIHYQTMSERGAEIINAFIKVVIAAVAVVATIKLAKWSKKRQQNTLLAHSDVDRLAWDVAANPTTENMQAFNKAWKRAKRLDFVNGILGLTTGSSSDTMSAMLGTMSNIIGTNTSATSNAFDGVNRLASDVQYNQTSIESIQRLIKPDSV